MDFVLFRVHLDLRSCTILRRICNEVSFSEASDKGGGDGARPIPQAIVSELQNASLREATLPNHRLDMGAPASARSAQERKK